MTLVTTMTDTELDLALDAAMEAGEAAQAEELLTERSRRVKAAQAATWRTMAAPTELVTVPVTPAMGLFLRDLLIPSVVDTDDSLEDLVEEVIYLRTRIKADRLVWEAVYIDPQAVAEEMMAAADTTTPGQADFVELAGLRMAEALEARIAKALRGGGR